MLFHDILFLTIPRDYLYFHATFTGKRQLLRPEPFVPRFLPVGIEGFVCYDGPSEPSNAGPEIPHPGMFCYTCFAIVQV